MKRSLIPAMTAREGLRVPSSLLLLLLVLVSTGCLRSDSSTEPTSAAPSVVETPITSPTRPISASPTPASPTAERASPAPASPTVRESASPTSQADGETVPEGQEVDLPNVELAYEIDATVEDFDAGKIAATMTASVTSREDAPIERLFFRVPPEIDDFFTLRSLVRDGQEIEPESSDGGTTLEVSLDPPLAPGSTVTLRFAFDLDLDSARQADPFNNAVVDDPVLRVGYWYPMLSNDAGFPPLLDPPYTVVADFDVRLVVPADVIVAAPAVDASPPVEVESGVEYRWELENGRDFALMLSREYEVEERPVAGVLVRLYTVPSLYGEGDAERQRAIRERIFEVAELSLAEYARLIGPYPWKTLVIAEGGRYLGGGIEYTALTIIDVAADWLDVLVAHEVVHMWFYAAIGTRTQDDPWIDEGVATFLSEGLLNGYEFSSDDGRGNYTDSLDASVYDLEGRSFNDWVTNIYTQGGSFFADLYIEMGDEDFWTAMREVYDTQVFDIITPYEMLTIFQSSTDEDLTPLYERYFAYEWIGE